MDRYYVTNSHHAIISKEKFEQVQEEKAKRARLVKNVDGTLTASSTKYNGKYLLGNLLFCGDCGASYRRRTERGKVMWRCATRIEKGRECCENSPSLAEEWIKSILIEKVCLQANVYEEGIIRKDVRYLKVYHDRIVIAMNSNNDIEISKV